jgi:hypothetical protein
LRKDNYKDVVGTYHFDRSAERWQGDDGCPLFNQLDEQNTARRASRLASNNVFQLPQ